MDINTHAPVQVYPLAHTPAEWDRQLREAIAINDAHRAKINARRTEMRSDLGLIEILRTERARRGLDSQIDWAEYFRNIGCIY